MSTKDHQISFRLDDVQFARLVAVAGKSRPAPFARDLVLKCISGEQESLARLLDQHDRRIRNALFRICGFVMVNVSDLNMSEAEIADWLEETLFPDQ